MRVCLLLLLSLTTAACAAGASSGSDPTSRSDRGTRFGTDAGTRNGTTAPVEEVCGDRVDNDGDRQVDEGCSCEGGTTQDCHPDGTVAGVGACAWGTQACGQGEFAEWSECTGAVLPTHEICGDGLDNDCDGLVDCMDAEDCNVCPGDCEITHDYNVELINVIDGHSKVESCGLGCVDLWVGQIGDNYWHGFCRIFEERTSVSISAPAAIQSAVLRRAKWDDYMQIHLNGAKVWSGPNDNFPPETSGECELATSWDQNPNVDLTSHFAAGGTIQFLIRVSVTDGGEGYAQIRIQYDPATLVHDPGWNTPDCVQSAQAIASGRCTGTVSCVDGPDDSGCVEQGSMRLCEEDVGASLVPSPVEGLSTMCRRAHVEVTGC